MKDVKGHGSNAHGSGVDQIGRAPMQPGMWYHGSPVGQPGQGVVHVGTALAASTALEARIGVPADGKGWDGSREYGKTLLAGKDTLDRLEKQGYSHYPSTGYNCGNDVPKNDYYPSQRTERATMGSGPTAVPVPLDATPAVRAYNIVGQMSNNTSHPTTDGRANGLAKRIKNSGTYYKNDGEDSGSISAVVPSAAHLRRAG